MTTTYTIKLNDGSILENIIMVNNSYVYNGLLNKELFSEANLIHVEITEIDEIDNEKHEIKTNYYNMKLVNFQTGKDQSFFTISPKTKQELLFENINAKLDFIAMMEDIEL